MDNSEISRETAWHIDAIDAALFTGDEFFKPSALKELREVLARWQRRVAEIERSM